MPFAANNSQLSTSVYVPVSLVTEEDKWRVQLWCAGLIHYKGLCRVQGGVSIRKTVLPGMAIPMLKIRRPNGRLIFNMDIAIRR